MFDALRRLLGVGQEKTVQLNSSNLKGPVTYPVRDKAFEQSSNAEIEHDGAKMYNQAHPGQVYHNNQNNEFQPGQLPSYLSGGRSNYSGYRQPVQPVPQPGLSTLMNSPINLQQSSNPITQFGDESGGMSIQGSQTPGAIPFQGSYNVPNLNTLQAIIHRAQR